MRLHPVKDGLIPLPAERGLNVRDRGGNKLVDTIDPKTGFCTGVSSPLTLPEGHVLTAKPPSGGSGQDVRFDSESARYYDLIRESGSDPIGLVIRTVADGDELLPCTRIRVVEAAASKSRTSERNSTAPVRNGGRGVSVRTENDLAVKSVLAGMGYKGPITREIRIACLEMIAIEKAVRS
jgi:hypothetical protein